MENNFQRSSGMYYAPVGISYPVCKPGEFRFAAVGLDHGHIYGMCNGLIEAGAQLDCIYDSNSENIRRFLKVHPGVAVACSYEEILSNPKINLIASASIPCNRAGIGIRAMKAGKNFFSDKPPVTTFEQLSECRRTALQTGRKFMVYFSERLHVESMTAVDQLIKDGAIGRFLHMDGFGPHRLSPEERKDWFFSKKCCGGILCDIGCHQIEQFLHFAGTDNVKIEYARTANYNNRQHPDFEDFGEIALTAQTGSTAYIRIDWFTPDALPVWGDGRIFLIGTDGYIEIRKYINLAEQSSSNHIFLCNKTDMKHIQASGTVGFPFFGALIKDCLNGTETAMTQNHVFNTLELALEAEKLARFYLIQ